MFMTLFQMDCNVSLCARGGVKPDSEYLCLSRCYKTELDGATFNGNQVTQYAIILQEVLKQIKIVIPNIVMSQI